MNFLFVAGFDFGTSYSKVVLQDQHTGIQKVVTFGDEFGALFPSFLRIGEDWVSGPEGNYDGLIVSYPKLVAADAGSGQSMFQSITSENYAEAKKQLGITDATIFAKTILVRFFLSTIQGIHHFLRNDDEWKIFDPAEDPLVIQIAVPTGLLESKDREVESLMVESLMAATLLHDTTNDSSDYSSAHDLVQAINQLDSLPTDEKDQLAKKCLSYPEVAAGVQPILQSRSVRDAKFITLDVGAGTIDLNVFQRWTKSGKKTLDYWACQVKPLGFARLPLADRRFNRGEHEISVNTIPERDLMKQVHTAVLTLVKDAFVYQPYQSYGDGASPWAGETLAYIWGGGSMYPAYQETLKAALKTFDIGVHEINQLPKPIAGLKLPPGLQFGRLAIAFGLSYYHLNLKKVLLPSSLKSYAERYGPEISSGYNCSCNGINPVCPNCFGSGIIQGTQKKEANLTALKSLQAKREIEEAENKKERSSIHPSTKSPPPNASQARIELQKLLDDFSRLPKPIPLIRRVRALNMIREQSFLLNKTKEQDFLNTVNDFLLRQIGRKGKILIKRQSVKPAPSGCYVKAKLTGQQEYPVRILHKNPKKLSRSINNPDGAPFWRLMCKILKDRETGKFILKSIPPHFPIPD